MKPKPPQANEPQRLPLSELIGAVGIALDLTATRPQGHVLRSCWIGMHLGWHMGLQQVELTDLYYCLLLKEALGRVVDAKSPFSAGHSLRVADWAVRIGERLGRTHAQRHFLRRAGLLHDIGKLGISNTILEKPGRPDPLERTLVNQHAAFTEAILERIGPFQYLAEIAAAHHEKLDGSGYPRGLVGDAIPMDARILAVADSYDALTSDRPHREAMPQAKALRTLGEMCQSELDPRCLDALLELLREEGLAADAA